MTTAGSVEDYDKLRKLKPHEFDIVLVHKQDANKTLLDPDVPLIPGGIFVWDDNSKDKDNDSTTIVPHDIIHTDKEKGRWKRAYYSGYEGPISVKWFGAKGDMKEYYEDDKGFKHHFQGGIKKGDNRLTLTSLDATGFTDSDSTNSKTIVIWEPGKDEEPLITTIKTRIDKKEVTLNDNAPKNMSGAYVAWGTDDTDAIQHTINVATETGHSVYLPPGHFIITRTLSYNTYQDMTKVGDRIFPLRDDYRSPYSLMKHGLQLLGAGQQVSFIHNLIKRWSCNKN